MKHFNHSAGRGSVLIQKKIYSVNTLDPSKVRQGALVWDKSTGSWAFRDATGDIGYVLSQSPDTYETASLYWVGTQAEYDNIAVKDDNTIYFILS